MTKKIIFIFFFILNFSVGAQNNSIKTINISDNFQFLKKDLKNVKVVLLGEITHNDGNVFELKTKIIEYLYKELGFKTIAFESGTYELWKAEQEIKAGKNITTTFQNSIFSIWSNAKEFQSFINFFEKNKNDLKLFGFDNQITGNYGEKLLFNDLFNYCKKEKIPFKLNQTDLELLIESILYANFFDEKDISYKNYSTSLNNILQKISKETINETHFYWKQIIKNLISLGEESYYKKQSVISSFSINKNDNTRDKQMANNLLAYIVKHPNEKIICWGANQHFVNNMNSIEKDTIKDFTPMGSYIKTKLKQKAYSLAMITAEDSIKLGGHWSKTPINKSSFEWFLKQKKQPLLFISSNQKSLNKKRLNRFFSPTTFINSNLSELHDGYIYLDKATPSSFISGNKSVTKTNEISKNKISGQVFDKKSKKTIPFVSVLIKDSYVGTSTNENGDFVIYSPNSLKGKSIIISSLGYKTAIINLNNNTSKIELEQEDILLDEVIIQSKTTAKIIVTKAINNFKKNYPIQHFNAINYSNAQIKVNNKVLLDFDVVLDYYSRGYNKSYRPTQKIKEIRWNTKEIEPAKKFRHFFDNGYNSIAHIKFRSQKRKIKKFTFNIEKQAIFQGKDIYIISFSTDRNHFNYTNQLFLSEYSGYLYINKKDFSIVKIIENWKVTDYSDNLKLYYNNFSNEFTFNKLTKTSLESNYKKKKNGKYYLEKSIYEEAGEVFDNNNNNKSLTYKKTLNSFWYNINYEKVKKISFKSENDEFKNVKYNTTFWGNYQFPSKF